MRSATTAVVRPRRRILGLRPETAEFYLWISPWIVGAIVFVVGPIFASFFISLTNWNILKVPTFIGFGNYHELLLEDDRFLQSLKVTLLYTVAAVPGQLLVALLLATALNRKLAGLRAFRTLFFSPVVLPGIAIALLWQWIYNPEYGLVNWLLALVGIKGPAWLNDPDSALWALVLMSFWSVGGAMLIFLAGLQSTPTELYEAAQIDGAGAFRRYVSITIPMLSSTIFFNLVMGLIGSFQEFVRPLVMTGGGPENATLFYTLFLYEQGFQNFRMGYAAALAWILFLIICAVTFLTFKTSSWVYYEAERS